MKRTLFEPDHEAFRDSVREFVARCIVPHEEKLIEQRFVDCEIWLEAGRNGYLGLAVPERFGGSDANDYRFNAVLGEELARSSIHPAISMSTVRGSLTPPRNATSSPATQ
jgi:long-chain-acyl-CoA dehydrogenase